ncbi:MAG TPA: UvrD-helicase domain-containing protein [Methanospirillum sp.]|nr:UvrD-helicase domain-containing protein [Methanospirillum sp.]
MTTAVTTGATSRQREAIDQHDLSMVVTAGAGTGKTYVLVEKYLSLIENQGLRPREILAMTFTDKAAAEMKERVRETIGRRILSEPDNLIWKQAAEEVIIAPIMTFHSFCAQILREFAIEAGLDPGFSIIDEGQAVSIRKDAFEQLLKKPSPGSYDALVRTLAQIEKFRLNEILSVITERSDWYTRFFEQFIENPDRYVEIWQDFLESVRKPAVTRFFADTISTQAIADLIRYYRRYEGAKDTGVAYLEQVSHYLSDLTPDVSPERLSRAAKGFLSVRPRGRIGAQKTWEKEDLERFRIAKAELTSRLENASQSFNLLMDPGSAYTRATLTFFSDLAIISGEYFSTIRELKRQASGIDFGDIISLTKQFLHENPDLVAQHIRPRIRNILVDEFQDTDPAQFDIITAIIGDISPGMNSLFIVGDPKQSIYLFRDADVTRFKEAQRKILSDCNGRLINLDMSFRSSREVIGIVNHLFGTIFASTEKPWEFGYEPIHTSTERLKCQGSVQVLLPMKAPSGGSGSESKEIEADMVADFVHRIVQTGSLQVTGRDGITRPASYGDIAILIERRTHLARYMDALSRNDTPFYVHGGIGFYSRQEIYDLYNILSFLLRPYDDAALYGVLRSPYFSLSDTTLFRVLTQPGFHRGSTLFEKLKHYLEEVPSGSIWAEEREQMQRAVNLLNEWAVKAGREPVVLFITHIIRQSGILIIYSAQEQGGQQIANLEKLVQIIRGRAEAGGYGLATLVHELTASIGAEEREGEAALDTLSQTSVNIMTVHAAKGLEFPVVILPDMGSSRDGKQSSLLTGDQPGIAGVKLPNPDNGYEIEGTPVYRALSIVQREKETAERKRLFYVAATRARDHLVFCGRQPDTFYATVEESSNRIDWVCTLLGITEEHRETGGIVRIDPGDGGDLIEVHVLVDPDQLTREWAYIRLPEIKPPANYLTRNGTREETCRIDDGSDNAPRAKIVSLSRILETDTGRGSIYEKSPGIPGCEDLQPEDVGTILHKVFSGIDPVPVLWEYGIRSETADTWLRTRYSQFLEHPILKGVTEEYCELSFVLPISNIAVEGRIDRLCRMEDGDWMVIDYKSGGCPHADLQMAVYRQAAEQLLSKPVSAFLYHIHSGETEIPDHLLYDEIVARIEQAGRVIPD